MTDKSQRFEVLTCHIQFQSFRGANSLKKTWLKLHYLSSQSKHTAHWWHWAYTKLPKSVIAGLLFWRTLHLFLIYSSSLHMCVCVCVMFFCCMQSNLTHHAVEAYLDRKTHNATLSLMDWHPQNSDIKIMESAKDHLESKWRKGLPTFSEKPSIVLQEL